MKQQRLHLNFAGNNLHNHLIINTIKMGGGKLTFYLMFFALLFAFPAYSQLIINIDIDGADEVCMGETENYSIDPGTGITPWHVYYQPH